MYIEQIYKESHLDPIQREIYKEQIHKVYRTDAYRTD